MVAAYPTPPLHTVAWFEKGRGNSLKCNSVNFSARRSQSGGIPARGVMTDVKTNARRFTVVSVITECWHTKFRHVKYVWFVESLQKHAKSIVNCRVQDWEASNGHTKDTTRLFHGPWHVPVGEHICAQPFSMWNRLRFIRLLLVSQIFQRRRSDANKQDLFWKWVNLTCQAQSTPKTIGLLTKVFSTSGPNLVALAWTGDELSRGQAQNGVNFYFEVKFDLKGQGQSPQKTIGILTKVFYTCVQIWWS